MNKVHGVTVDSITKTHNNLTQLFNSYVIDEETKTQETVSCSGPVTGAA